MPFRRKVIAMLASASAAAASIAVAPTAMADNSENCVGLSTSATKCEKRGNVEINDSFARSNTLPQWGSQGQQSGGPYGGAVGGGAR